MAFESLTCEVHDGVARVTLTQGQRGNPFDLRLCSELAEVSMLCAEDDAVRCVLLTAEGRFFSVGGDLAGLGTDRDGLRQFIQAGTAAFHTAISRFSRMDAPLVIAVHAMCAGGGVSLAAAGDFCLASASAQFYSAYTGIGLAIDGGGSHRLPRLVGARRATSFYLRNERWSAAQACDYGLVGSVHEDDALAAAALTLATELAAGPTRSFGEVKNLLLSSADTPLEAQLELEARAMARTARTDDAWNAITDVAARARPAFSGA